MPLGVEGHIQLAMVEQVKRIFLVPSIPAATTRLIWGRRPDVALWRFGVPCPLSMYPKPRSLLPFLGGVPL